jgi:hypothetical protein
MYWVQEQWHESKVFAMIAEGDVTAFENQITFTVQDKEVLPAGYAWEEEGREFIHQGMLYDIIAIKKIEAGWLITAAADEAEAEWEAKEQKMHTDRHGTDQHNTKSKLSISKVWYDIHTMQSFTYISLTQQSIYHIHQSNIHLGYLGQFSPPPEFA